MKSVFAGRHRWRIRENFFVEFTILTDVKSPTNKTYVYGKLVVTVSKGRNKSFHINRKTWHKRYIEACEKQAEIQGWRHAPKSWLKAKPKFDEVLKRCHAIEDGDKRFIRLGTDD